MKTSARFLVIVCLAALSCPNSYGQQVPALSSESYHQIIVKGKALQVQKDGTLTLATPITGPDWQDYAQLWLPRHLITGDYVFVSADKTKSGSDDKPFLGITIDRKKGTSTLAMLNAGMGWNYQGKMLSAPGLEMRVGGGNLRCAGLPST